MPTTKNTAGHALTVTLRERHHIGARTRWGRDGWSCMAETHTLRHEIVDMVRTSNQYPGYYNETVTAALRPALAVINGWTKHIESCRADPVAVAVLKSLSPWEFTAFLGRLVDDGVSNNGAMETWLAAHVAEFREQYTTRFNVAR